MTTAVAVAALAALTASPGYLGVLTALGAAVAFVALSRHEVLGRAATLATALLLSYHSPLVPAETRPLLIGGVCVLAGLAVARSTRRELRVVPVGLVAGYLAITLLSLARTNDRSIAEPLGYAAMALAGAWIPSLWQKADLQLFARSVVHLGVLETCIGILVSPPLSNSWLRSNIAAENIAGSAIYRFLERPNLILQGDFIRVGGSVGHPLPYALFLLLGIALIGFGATNYKRRPSLALAAFLAIGVLLSGSRTPIAAGIVALCVTLMRPGGGGRGVNHTARFVALAFACGSFYSYVRFAVENARTYSPGSLEHRLGATENLQRLLTRSDLDVLLGSGSRPQELLRQQGVLVSTVQFDNQYATTFAAFGIIGLTVILGLFLWAAGRGAPVAASMAVIFGVMCLSFDLLSWPLFMFLAWLLCSIRITDRPGPDHETPVPDAERSGRRDSAPELTSL